MPSSGSTATLPVRRRLPRRQEYDSGPALWYHGIRMTIAASDSVAWLRRHWLRILLTAGAAAVFFGNHGFRSLVTNWLELRSVSREIAALEAENGRTAARIKELRQSDAAVEREARKVGFGKPGEIEYRFDPPKR